MTARKRIKLVPSDCVEIFEVRAALYYDSEGDAIVATDISTPHGKSNALVHEVLGVLRRAESIIEQSFDGVLE